MYEIALSDTKFINLFLKKNQSPIKKTMNNESADRNRYFNVIAPLDSTVHFEVYLTRSSSPKALQSKYKLNLDILP